MLKQTKQFDLALLVELCHELVIRGRWLGVFAMVSEGFQKHRDVVVVKTVESLAAVPSDVYEPSLAQKSELMRSGRRGHLRKRSKLVHGPLLVEHCPEQLQPAPACKKPHRVGKFKRLMIAEGSAGGFMLGWLGHVRNATPWVKEGSVCRAY